MLSNLKANPCEITSKMNRINMNFMSLTSKTGTAVKSESNTTDVQLSSQSPVQQEPFPKWITDFNDKCLKICGTKCSEKLDEMMELYIKEVKREVVRLGPANASVIVNRMNRTMLFFYQSYLDIKEFIVISQWYENMEDLLSLYCQLELRSSQRLHRGKDSDVLICSRIMYALWVFLNSNEEHMLHVLLKLPNISKRYKEILDPIFRKLLLNKPKPQTDLEYIRKLFAFKLWKRVYNVDEKKAISQLACTDLIPPRSLINNYSKYYFLPRNIGTGDIHKTLVTAMFDVESAIKNYFEYVDKKNKRNFESDYSHSEKRSFMADFWHTFPSADDLSTTSDTFTLERIKQEVDNIDVDDDCIIIEPEETLPASTQPKRITDPSEIVDLTNLDEDESPIDTQIDIVPLWCLTIINKAEQCAPVTPPHSITDEETHTQEQNFEKTINDKEETGNVIQMCGNASTEERMEISTVENNKTELTADLDAKISNVRRARLNSDSTDTFSSGVFEDNSDGLREITSTSHSDKEIITSNSFSSSETIPVNNYEQVDSTSNFNENEVDVTLAPIIKPFIVDRTIEQHPNNELVNVISEVPHESNNSAPIPPVALEQYTSTLSNQIEDISLNPVIVNTCTKSPVSNLNIVSVEHQSEDCSIGKIDALNIAFSNSILTEHEEDDDVEVDVGSEENFESPDIEPITQNDYEDYVKRLDPSQYNNFYKDSTSKIIKDKQNSKKRNNDEYSQRETQQIHRTYTKHIQKTTPTQEDIPTIIDGFAGFESRERRVPVNGEKVLRFANNYSGSFFSETFKLSKTDTKLFNPLVVLKKHDSQNSIPESSSFVDTKYILNSESFDPRSIDYSHRDKQRASNYNMKGIIERHEYMKPTMEGQKPRARIFHVNRNLSSTSTSTSTSNISNEVIETRRETSIAPSTTLKKKRGTGSPDSSINLTLPKLESLSLNSSFQHHFCTDISACTSASKCFAEMVSVEVNPANPVPSHLNTIHRPTSLSYVNNSQSQQQIDFKLPVAINETACVPPPSTPRIIEPKQEVVSASEPILPAEVPYWHEIDSSEPPQKFDHSQACPDLLFNINLDQTDQEIHLPIKKRRVSSLKVEIRDELSYPPTPMISIAELENIEAGRNKAQNNRPFKTLAELKEVPPLPPSYLSNTNHLPEMPSTNNDYNISYSYNIPHINYHVNNVPVINLQYTPHYQLPSIQPIILPVTHASNTNWTQQNFSYTKFPVSAAGKPECSGTSAKRKQRYPQAASRISDSKETVNSKTVQKTKSHKSKIL